MLKYGPSAAFTDFKATATRAEKRILGEGIVRIGASMICEVVECVLLGGKNSGALLGLYAYVASLFGDIIQTFTHRE